MADGHGPRRLAARVSDDPSPSGPVRGRVDGPTRRANLWSLDEYVVVADLYLRRGRSSGVGDPEVVELARLTGRTPASISRRLGNFDGTAREGMGLKPVTGEARNVFVAMQGDATLRDRLAREAKGRLAERRRRGARSEPRLVDPEEFRAETADVITPAAARQLHRVEAQLVRRYRGWLDPAGGRLRGLVIPADDRTLRADLLDTKLHLLIEAKGATTREHVRYALGQLLDYRRYVTPRPRLALLVPNPLSADLGELQEEIGIGTIWPAGEGFTDSDEGRLSQRYS